MQTTLALGALLLVMLLSVTMYRGMAGTHQRMLVNEVATQLTGVGEEVLGRISSAFFDSAADSTQPGYTRITSENDLTAEAAFGAGSCNYPRASTSNHCTALEDYHDKNIVIERDGLTFYVRIEVRYVEPLNPNISAGRKTFAKEVLLEIANPNLYMDTPDNPLTVLMSRVFTYDKTLLPVL